ncbi:hypothetical protein [Methylophaga sp.]|uniref:hypothetical protein n=1 Tax=Methylophaga sp. TaxID=2024840 RepID=UPI003A90D0C1
MSHVRQQIREALKAVLKGLPITQDRVFVNRVDPILKGTVPALTIRTGNDQKTEVITMGKPALVARQVDVFVTAYAVGDEVDDQLDDICIEVEKTIASNSTLSGLVKNIEYMESEHDLERSEKLKGIRENGFQCIYFIQEDDPETALN